MAQDIGTLLSQSNCLQCLTAAQREIIALTLLNNIAAGANTATVDIQALLSAGQCFSCLSEGERGVIELSLLSAIATALGV